MKAQQKSIAVMVLAGLALAGSVAVVSADDWVNGQGAGATPAAPAAKPAARPEPEKKPKDERPTPEIQLRKVAPGDARELTGPDLDDAGVMKIKEGRYLAEGTMNGGAKTYTANVVIKKVGQNYLIGWYMENVLTYQGLALVSEGYLHASCTMEGQARVGAYRMQENGVLTGRWATMLGVVDTETLTFQTKVEPAVPAGAAAEPGKNEEAE